MYNADSPDIGVVYNKMVHRARLLVFTLTIRRKRVYCNGVEKCPKLQQIRNLRKS